jgi:hypothetical protein
MKNSKEESVCALPELDAKTLCRRDPRITAHEVLPVIATPSQVAKVTCEECLDEMRRVS